MPIFKCESCDKTFHFKSRYFKHISTQKHKDNIKPLTISTAPTFSNNVNQIPPLQEGSEDKEESIGEIHYPIEGEFTPTPVTRCKGHNVSSLFVGDGDISPTTPPVEDISPTPPFIRKVPLIDPFILDLFSEHGVITKTVSFVQEHPYIFKMIGIIGGLYFVGLREPRFP